MKANLHVSVAMRNAMETNGKRKILSTLVLRQRIQRHIEARRPSESSSLGLLRRAIAPVVRWRQRTVCMCALTDTSLHASGSVHESATGRPHLSDGPSSHELEYTGALAASWFIT